MLELENCFVKVIKLQGWKVGIEYRLTKFSEQSGLKLISVVACAQVNWTVTHFVLIAMLYFYWSLWNSVWCKFGMEIDLLVLNVCVLLLWDDSEVV